jgi:hypothetical protein
MAWQHTSPELLSSDIPRSNSFEILAYKKSQQRRDREHYMSIS